MSTQVAERIERYTTPRMDAATVFRQLSDWQRMQLRRMERVEALDTLERRPLPMGREANENRQ